MRRPWIGGKDFHNFYWTKKISSRRGDEKFEQFLGGLLLASFFFGRGGKG
jgi:hypothetical protein